MVMNLNPFFSKPPLRIFEAEKNFENQEINLTESLQVDEGKKLMFRNCTLTSEGTPILVKGELVIENCEIISTDGGFLTAMEGGSVLIRESHFSVAPTSYNVIYMMDRGKLLTENCTFAQELTTVPVTPKECSGERPLINAQYGKFVGCTFTNIDLEIRAKTVTGSTFTNCKNVCCDDTEPNNLIDNCTFIGCTSVTIENGMLRGSTFAHLETLYVTWATVEDCKFRECVVQRNALIFMENGIITRCGFENMELRNNAWMCDATGKCRVEHSNFTKCRTEREDCELFHCEEISGKVVKKKKEVKMVDCGTCTGLELVTDLFGSIVIGSFSLED